MIQLDFKFGSRKDNETIFAYKKIPDNRRNFCPQLKGPDRNKISACLIVKNEETIIENCLKSLEGAVDEIIIVDQYSTDDTVKICEKYTDRIYKRRMLDNNFSKQRNYALSKAKYGWIFVTDADESLSEKLRKNLKELVKHDEISGYSFPVVKVAKNKPLLHGTGYPTIHLRLFQKAKGKYDSNILIHEKVELKGKMKRMELGYDILHHKSHDFGDFKKVINHTRIHARRSNIKAQLLLIISILWGYSMKGGFLDGYDGFRYHLFKIYYSFCVIYFIIKNWLIMIANKGDN